MKLIKPSWEILEQSSGLQGIYKQIELAGRTCYKSLDKITDDSAEGFVNRMIKSQHYAMLEHGTVYLNIPQFSIDTWQKYCFNSYSKVSSLVNIYGVTHTAITTNYRVLIENGWLDDLKYLCEPTEHHEKRVTVRFTTSNGIMREFTRHRVMSFAVESTRYCNYSKDKFNNEVTFIIPSWCSYEEATCTFDNSENWNEVTKPEFLLRKQLVMAEWSYLKLIEMGCKPQEAREVLPLATKCDMVMTGFISDWQHFFDLRARGTTGAPHPDAKALAEPLMHEFETQNLI